MAVITPAGELGSGAPDFVLPNVDGLEYALADVRGRRGLVVAFICNHCPYVRAIFMPIERDASALRKIGVGFVAVNSNDARAYPDDSFEQMRRVAAEQGFTFPYLYDESQSVARAYGAVCTPDFFGFDAALRLRYRGRLDASRKKAEAGAARELFDAMSKIAVGGEAPITQYPSIGCTIKWKADRRAARQ